MRKRYLILMLLFSFVLAGSAYEIRIWEDKNGEQYKGRFLRELFGKLTIEGEDGSRRVFELEGLSELDQKYLRVKVPPELKIEIRMKSKRVSPPVNTTRPYIIDDWRADVVITKKSQRPFTSRLKAEIFLVAGEVDGSNYILLERSEHEFVLPEISKNTQLQLRSKVSRTEQVYDWVTREMRGEDVEGCLVVISTLQGQIVCVETTLGPSWFRDPEVINNLRQLSIEGAPSVRSRHFDKTGKKVPPPRQQHRSPTEV